MMEWSGEAEKELSKVPFFVRKKVRKKVEEYASGKGSDLVEPFHLSGAKQNFMNNMDKEIKGYSLEVCFGEKECKNSIGCSSDFINNIEALLKEKDILSFLKKNSGEKIKFHQEFKVSISLCPNSCSRPQISDIGLIAAQKPFITDAECVQCMDCVKICKEKAVNFKKESFFPFIDYEKCLFCSDCIKTCTTGTIKEAKTGFRILAGGKLGRHPRLGRDFGEIYSEEQVLEKISAAADIMISQKNSAKRFSNIFNDNIFEELKK
jgi:dissimilatory sulfite reductase (desulfoviridin) alpha/beta subunit